MRESTLLHSRFQSQFKFLTLTLPCSPSNSCSCCQSKQVESKWSPVNPFLKAHCLQLFIYKDLNTICFLLPSLVFLLIISSLTVSIAESKRIFLSSVPFFGHSPTVFFPSSHLHLPLHRLGVLSWEKSFFTLLSSWVRGSHLCFYVSLCVHVQKHLIQSAELILLTSCPHIVLWLSRSLESMWKRKCFN